jgi:hypothetical protein
LRPFARLDIFLFLKFLFKLICPPAFLLFFQEFDSVMSERRFLDSSVLPSPPPPLPLPSASSTLDSGDDVKVDGGGDGDSGELLNRIVGNPIHAYKMMKRFSIDWKKIELSLEEDDWAGN